MTRSETPRPAAPGPAKPAAMGDAPLEDAAETRLRSQPDWRYLLREYYEMYRRSSSGGSTLIRAHQRLVRETLSRILESDPPVRFHPPQSKPVCAHLKRALDRGRLERTATVIRAIESVAHHLVWSHGYDRMPRGLAEKYAYAEILGPNGQVAADSLILGLVLFAPRCTYPAHSHAGITESYYCLSGAVSENDDGVYGPGSMIFNPPGRNHRITVDANEPCLLAYAWAGAPEALAHQVFAFKRQRR